jgi:hypothetical protein
LAKQNRKELKEKTIPSKTQKENILDSLTVRGTRAAL